MLTPDAKRIWKTAAGGSLMAAMLGLKTIDGGDEATIESLRALDAGNEDRVRPDPRQADAFGANDSQPGAEFKEAQHPRASNGEFGSGGESTAETAKPEKKTAWTMEGGGRPSDDQTARLSTLRVPPAWTDIKLSADPTASLQVVGKDAKGRSQYLYSTAHSAKAAAEKFARLKAFNAAAKGIVSKSNADMLDTEKPQRIRDAAAVTQLIAKTGFRIGSDTDTGAEVKAHGASTLRGDHVEVSGDELTFDFIGKKGVNIKKTLTDPALAKYIGERKAEVGSGQLFTSTDANVRDYFHGSGGADFKVKDFRTWNATNLALQEMSKPPEPKTEAEFKKKQLAVAKVVAANLGNTPKVALDSYIDPAVWEYRP